VKKLTPFPPLLFAMMAFVFSGAFVFTTAHSSPDSLSPYRVGVLYGSEHLPSHMAMRRGLETTVEKINHQARDNGHRTIQLIPHVAGDGPDATDKQIRQMTALLGQKPDLIIVQPLNSATLSLELLRANRENIPVVAFDQHINGPGKMACFLGPDNFQAGFNCGEYIAHRFGTSNTLSVILVEYPPVAASVDRVNGFLRGLKAQKQPFQIARTYEAFDPVAGKKAANMIRRQHPMPSSIDVVFTVNGGSSLGVVEELLYGGRNEIALATVGGDPASVENIRNGNLTVIDSARFCWHLGAKAMLAGLQLLEGNQDLPRTILLPVFPVTEETLDQYHGWYGDIPEDFTKPWDSTEPEWRWEMTTPDGEVITLDEVKAEMGEN
jgi:ribose transport system substrate-binding protein